MIVPLSGEAREILRALLHGLELREIDGEWGFVGHWQDIGRSHVSSVTMSELIGSQLVSIRGGSQAIITKSGEEQLFRLMKDETAAVLKWFHESA